MANQSSFGWCCGTHYAPHLSDGTMAVFSGVLIMPWASVTDRWSQNPTDIPELDQLTCKAGFGSWLTPWDADIEWALYRVLGNQLVRIAGARPITANVAAAHTVPMRQRATERLHSLVERSTRAMGFETQDDGRVLTYPIASSGVSQVPAPISDTVLGTSAVLAVARADMQGESVVALPTFTLSGTVVKPKAAGPVTPADPNVMEFLYEGSAPVQVAGKEYIFRACVSNHLKEDTRYKVYPPRRVEIRNGKPLRQIYASVSRECYPLRLWLDSLDAPLVDTLGAFAFVQKFAAFMGSGEDELDAARSPLGSIYEVILSQEDYAKVFGGLGSNTTQVAAAMLAKFQALCADKVQLAGLLQDFAVRAEGAGLADAKRASELLADAAQIGFGNAAQDIAPAQALESAHSLARRLAESSPSSRTLWTCWFVTVLFALRSPGAPQTLKDFVEDDALRVMNGQIDYAPDYWFDLHKADDVIAAMQAYGADLRDAIVARGWDSAHPDAKIRANLDKAYTEAIDHVKAVANTDSPEADDPPLQLRYSAAPDFKEEAIRGCILALRAGVPRSDGTIKWLDPEWITTFEAMDGSNHVKNDAGTTVVFIDTQGATNSDALAEHTAVYNGEPLFAAQPLDDEHSVSTLIARPVAPAKRPAPIALGVRYEAIAGTIENAGTIVEEALRDAANWADPMLAATDFDPLHIDDQGQEIAAFRLLSRQPPGAPVIGKLEDHGVGAETFTSEVLVRGGLPPRIAVLYAGNDYIASTADHATQSILLRAPSVTPVTLERWLRADALVDANDEFRWQRVKTLQPAEIVALIDEARNAPTVDVPSSTSLQGGKRTQVGVTHPAVTHVAARITWFLESDAPIAASAIEKLPLLHLKADGKSWIRDEAVTVHAKRVQSGDPGDAKFAPHTASRTFNVSIPQGMRAKVEVFSVIDAAYLDDDAKARFKKTALAGPNRPYAKHTDGNYITAEPPTFWIESLPDVIAGDVFAPAASALKLVHPSTAQDKPWLQLVLANAQQPARWISAFNVEHKRWQWTGYPNAFPRDGSISAWLSLYTGAVDSMPSLPDGSFTTRFDNGWKLRSAVMQPVPLPHARGANHMGLVLTPIPRFARILNPELFKQCLPVHVFATLHAAPLPDSVRLQPPVWLEAIPMPHSREVASDLASTAAAPSNLAVFKDPVYDTSDTTLFGGIAERLELDVPSAWDQKRLELGPNPIFHAAPGATKEPWLEMGDPFGLGYDRVIGGRPAQTAAVIRVRDGAGKWLLAKCRVRRLVDPELVLDSELANGTSAVLGLRQVEDGWVPEDIAIYCTTPIAQLTLGASYTLQLMPFAQSFPAIYLLTWHRDRWAAATPTWRPLVKVYKLDVDRHAWHALEGTSGRLIGPNDFPPLGPVGGIELTLPKAATVRKLHASDFTESRWLTFIGSFEVQAPIASEDLEVKRNGNGYRLKRATGDGELPHVGRVGEPRATLLMLFAPSLDLMRGRVDQDGGELFGVFATSRSYSPGDTHIDFDVPLHAPHAPPPDCRGLLIQLHRHNVDTDVDHAFGANDWSKVMTMMFPEQDGPEASLRLLPEFIGPLNVS